MHSIVSSYNSFHCTIMVLNWSPIMKFPIESQITVTGHSYGPQKLYIQAFLNPRLKDLNDINIILPKMKPKNKDTIC